MSVWPNTAFSSFPLCGTEGALVSVSVNVEPRDLELALDALAQLSYPINPQIYHDGAVLTLYADGRQERDLVAVLDGGVEAVQEADVLPTDVDVHESPQVSVLGDAVA